MWGLHLLLTPSSSSVPVVITAARLSSRPPVDYLLWVLQQHQTGYKSHCITTAPRFASLSSPPTQRFPLACSAPRSAFLCGTSVQSYIPPPSLGPAIGGEGLSLSCQSCSALCASRSTLLSATRWVRSEETRCIPTETQTERLEVFWPGRTDSILLSEKNIIKSDYRTVWMLTFQFSCVFREILLVLQGTESQTKSVWDIWAFCCDIFFWQTETFKKISLFLFPIFCSLSLSFSLWRDLLKKSDVEELDYFCWDSSSGSCLHREFPQRFHKEGIP